MVDESIFAASMVPLQLFLEDSKHTVVWQILNHLKQYITGQYFMNSSKRQQQKQIQ